MHDFIHFPGKVSIQQNMNLYSYLASHTPEKCECFKNGSALSVSGLLFIGSSLPICHCFHFRFFGPVNSFSAFFLPFYSSFSPSPSVLSLLLPFDCSACFLKFLSPRCLSSLLGKRISCQRSLALLLQCFCLAAKEGGATRHFLLRPNSRHVHVRSCHHPLHAPPLQQIASLLRNSRSFQTKPRKKQLPNEET